MVIKLPSQKPSTFEFVLKIPVFIIQGASVLALVVFTLDKLFAIFLLIITICTAILQIKSYLASFEEVRLVFTPSHLELSDYFSPREQIIPYEKVLGLFPRGEELLLLTKDDEYKVLSKGLLSPKEMEGITEKFRRGLEEKGWRPDLPPQIDSPDSDFFDHLDNLSLQSNFQPGSKMEITLSQRDFIPSHFWTALAIAFFICAFALWNLLSTSSARKFFYEHRLYLFLPLPFFIPGAYYLLQKYYAKTRITLTPKEWTVEKIKGPLEWKELVIVPREINSIVLAPYNTSERQKDLLVLARGHKFNLFAKGSFEEKERVGSFLRWYLDQNRYG